MALSGIHVACFMSAKANDETPLPRPPVWSETLAFGSTTSQAAIGPNGANPASENLLFRMNASADCYVAIGKAPNAGSAVSTSMDNARHFVRGNVEVDLLVRAGDKLAVVAA